MFNKNKVIACLYAGVVAASAMENNPIAMGTTDNLTQTQEVTVRFDGNPSVAGSEYIKFDIASVGNAIKINEVSMDFSELDLCRLFFNPTVIATPSFDIVPKAGKPGEFDIVVIGNKKEVNKPVKPNLINLIIPGEIEDGLGNKKQIHIGRKAFQALMRNSLSSLPVRINLQFAKVNGRKVQLADNCSEMFFCSKLIDTIDFSGADSSNVTDMSCMFSGCSNLKKIIFSGFNTSNVTTMEGMFEYCEKLNSLDLTAFNTNNVTDMSWMFSQCKSLSEITCNGNFNTHNVTDMSYMFSGCVSLTHLPELDMQNVKEDGEMFDDCISCIYKQAKAENVINAPVPEDMPVPGGIIVVLHEPNWEKYLKHRIRSWTSSLFD